MTARDRHEAQAVEIVFALFVGCAVLIVLVVGGLWAATSLGLTGMTWAGPYGLVVAAASALACTVGVLVRARRNGL